MANLLWNIDDTKKTVVERIFIQAENSPDKIALICDEQEVNYRDLCKLIYTSYLFLLKNNVNKNTRIMVEAYHSKYCIGLYYGVHLLGGILVPFEKNAPEDRIKQIAEDISADLIISRKKLNLNNNLCYEELINQEIIDYQFSDLVFPDLNSPCEMVFTTGTTGKSKGVLLSHSNISFYSYSVANAIKMKKDNRFFITTPLNHAGGMRRTHLSLANGCCVVYLDGLLNIKKYFSYIEKYQVTSLYLPPVAIRLLLNVSKDELSKYQKQIDFVYSSSSPLPYGDCLKLKEILPFTRLYNAYEASETPGVSVYDYNCNDFRKSCIGKANDGVELAVLDEQGNFTNQEGIKGQICIKSPMNMLEYYNSEELTKAVKINDYFISNDIGYFDKQGYLYYVSRKGDVINIGGYKISPSDVEEVSLLSGMVKECICICKENKLNMKQLNLLVVPNDNFDVKELLNYISSKLEAYKVPKKVEIVDSIQKTFNGKIDRKYYRE